MLLQFILDLKPIGIATESGESVCIALNPVSVPIGAMEGLEQYSHVWIISHDPTNCSFELHMARIVLVSHESIIVSGVQPKLNDKIIGKLI